MDPIEATRRQTSTLSSLRGILSEIRNFDAERGKNSALSAARTEHESDVAILRKKHSDEVQNLKQRHAIQVEAAERLVRDVAPRIADEARKGLEAEARCLREEIARMAKEREVMQRRLLAQRTDHLRSVRDFDGGGAVGTMAE